MDQEWVSDLADALTPDLGWRRMLIADGGSLPPPRSLLFFLTGRASPRGWRCWREGASQLGTGWWGLALHGLLQG